MDDNYTFNLTSRQWFFVALLGVVMVLLAALYFQFYAGYQPCPLCVMQRIIFMLIALVLLIAVLHRPQILGIRIYAILVFSLSIIGNIFAIRQVWLQSLPKDLVPGCGPNFNFIVQHLPLTDAVRQIFYGSADCAKVNWQFLHLSFAAWAIVFFSLLMVNAFWQLLVPRRSRIKKLHSKL